jgi:hypothetical protein
MTSQVLDKFGPAMVKAQAEMPTVAMDATGQVGNRKYKYATLGAVISATREVLAKYGFSVIQQVISNDTGDAVGIRTMILHESGQSMSWDAVVKIPLEGNPGQEAGKLITYLRRYSLAAALNLYADEDIDNNTTKQQSGNGKGKVSKPATTATMTIEQAGKVTNRDGVPYTEIPSERLSHMSGSLLTSLKNNGHDQEKTAEIETKVKAIKTILTARSTGEINEP